MTKRDANWWREECSYISGVCDKKGRVKEMNNDPDVFRRYCEMQMKLAESDGFYDAATYIGECIDDLPTTRKKNPLTRVKVNSPSMATGQPPSKRLIARRKKTAKAPPGIYANPKARTTFTKDSQRPRWSDAAQDYTQAASRRLVSRRKKTATAPMGFFANPVERGTKYGAAKSNAEPRNLLQYFVQWMNSVSGQWRTVASFASAAEAKIFAHDYSRKHPEKTIRVATDD